MYTGTPYIAHMDKPILMHRYAFIVFALTNPMKATTNKVDQVFILMNSHT